MNFERLKYKKRRASAMALMGFRIFIYSKKYLFIYEYLPRLSFLQLNELLSMRVLPFFVKYLKKGPKEFVCCIYSLLVSITIDI